jgi:hypothetical protein
MNLKEYIQSEIKSQLGESVVTEAAERDYKKEYAKYGKSEKSKKYRAELNKYNRDKGTYGNGDGKDASHKDGKIVGFESESKNRGRAEKSRLKKEAVDEDVELVSEAGEDVNNAIIPSDIKIKLEKALDVLKGKKLSYQQRVQVLGRVLDSLNIDKAELNKVTSKLKTKLESVNEAITDGDVVIFKKQKGEVPKITYNSSRKQFAADFLSHTDYYKNLTDAIEDMQDAGFKIEKHIQTESVNEGKQYKKGDKLKIKLKNGKEFDLTFDSYGRQKGMAFGKFDGDKKPFSLDTIKEEQLDEKLITFSNRAPYGQVVFMAGGAGSGKGFAIDNFIDAAGFKVRDVDEMKKALGKLDELGKVSVDSWFKKYGNKLSTKPPKNNPKGMTEREHIEEFVLGKNLSISDIASDLKNPNNVASLHYIVDTMGLKDKWLINMLKGKSNKETLPNLLFDITAKKVASITEVIEPLLSAGYDPKNIHLIWVLTNYYTAVEANKDRDRVVPDDILLQTHEGAAKTMWEVLTQIKPKGLEGRIDVILNNRDQTAFFVDDKGKKIKVEPSQQNKLKEAEPIVKGFKSLPIKKQGGGIVPENVWKDILKDWILKNVPKTISLTQDVMKTSKDK